MIPHLTISPKTHTIIVSGIYPFSYPGHQRNFEIAFEKFSLSADVITIDAREPCLFLDKQRNIITFEFLHKLIERTGFKKPVIFKLVHLHASSCYDSWCKSNNIEKRIIIQDDSLMHHLSRPIIGGYQYCETTKDKILSLLIGNLRFQKAHVLEWYLNNIFQTDYENKVLASFMIESRHKIPARLDYLQNQISQLPGKFSDNSQTRNFFRLWDGQYSKDAFNSQFSRSLFNFCVDYTEFEDFQDYTVYEKFKHTHPWWKENAISEKTFLCILFKQPFIRLGMPNSLKILHDWGFRTFDGVLFDESYDRIEHFYDRSTHIFSQVKTYLDMSFDTVYDKIHTPIVQDIITHNYNLAMDMLKSDKYI